MKQLKNGAWIIDLKTRDHQCYVVLARLDSPENVQWVTWVVDPEGVAHWGHYFDNLTDAVENYNSRN